MLKKRHNDLGVGHDGQCGAARGMQEGLCAIPGLGTFSPQFPCSSRDLEQQWNQPEEG